MSTEPKSAKPAEEVKDATTAPRRRYAAPRLKRLGSVRDLTLGSPSGLLMDGVPGGKRSM